MIDTRSGASEWRLYIVAVVAGVYVFTWSRVAPRREEQAAKRPPAVWLDELSLEQQPTVRLPPGWRVAERGESVARIPSRVSPVELPRIRTRSS